MCRPFRFLGFVFVMALGFGSNINAIRVQRQLTNSSSRAAQSLERLSSGQRINRASDDAASLAVASGLNATSRIFGQAIKNVNDGVSLLNVADSTLSALNEILQRQIELASQSANGTYSSSQRFALNKEAQQLHEEYNRQVQSASFNGLKLLNGSNGRINVQAGIGTAGVYSVDLLRHLSSSSQITGTGTYRSEAGAPNNGGSIAVGDFNGDGRDDVVVGFGIDPGGDGTRMDFYASVYLSDSGGNLVLQNTYSLGSASGTEQDPIVGYHFSVGVGFQDGDAGLDIGFNVDVSRSSGIQASMEGVLILSQGNNFDLSPGETPSFALDSVLSATGDFNGDGFTDNVNSNGQLNIQNTTTKTVTAFESLLQSSFNLHTRDEALLALDTLRTTLDSISRKRGELGSQQSRFSVALSNLDAQRTNIDASRSRLIDADIGFESANLVREQILQRAGAEVLASANLNPRIALDLLRSAG